MPLAEISLTATEDNQEVNLIKKRRFSAVNRFIERLAEIMDAMYFWY